jgi:hypothetical protein
MANVRRLLAFVLLVAGVVLVVLGLTRALGITPYSVLVCIVAIVALLYTRGIWFGAPPPRSRVTSATGDGSPILFDVNGLVVSGPHRTAGRFPVS